MKQSVEDAAQEVRKSLRNSKKPKSVVVIEGPPSVLEAAIRAAGKATPDPERWEAVAANLHGDERAVYSMVISRGGRLHQADLVRDLRFSNARMTRVLKRLEEKDLLQKRRDGMGNLVVLF